MRLTDRVAIVTGAQQGIGEAIALAFAREGGHVVINYLDDKGRADEIVREIEASGREACAVRCNVGVEKDVLKLVDAAKEMGGPDVLVNNAGIFPRVKFLEMTEEQWDNVLNVNLKGAFLCTREATKAMARHKRGGAVVNISSIVANIGSGVGAHYTASKAGLIGLTRSNALALGSLGIRVNAIAPGIVDTAQPREAMSEDEMYKFGETLPLGRVIQPKEVADTAVFLASNEAIQITGQVIHVNGGHIFD